MVTFRVSKKWSKKLSSRTKSFVSVHTTWRCPGRSSSARATLVWKQNGSAWRSFGVLILMVISRETECAVVMRIVATCSAPWMSTSRMQCWQTQALIYYAIRHLRALPAEQPVANSISLIRSSYLKRNHFVRTSAMRIRAGNWKQKFWRWCVCIGLLTDALKPRIPEFLYRFKKQQN